jgi:phosphoribosylglycinamide formyltransferase 1
MRIGCFDHEFQMSQVPLPIVVLLSGSGTTLQNLMDRQQSGSLPIEIRLVISSKSGVAGLTRAENAGIKTQVISRKTAGSLQAFSQEIFKQCRSVGAELVCLAGFLQLIEVPDDFLGKVMNIHPSLLPAFGGHGMYGHHVHEAVLAYGAKVSGCTVHFADNQYDQGPVIVQRACYVLNEDTPDTLARRVFAEECEAYPEAIRMFAEGRLHIDGRIVRWKQSTTLMNQG